MPRKPLRQRNKLNEFGDTIRQRSCFTIMSTYGDDDIIVFPVEGKLRQGRHHSLIAVADAMGYTKSKSWLVNRRYSVTHPGRKLRTKLMFATKVTK